MPHTLIKICGITRLDDALAALEAGADWLGFIRWEKSPRYRPIEAAAKLLSDLRDRAPRPFQAVAVYVDAPRETIQAELNAAGFDRLQFHGAEPAAALEGWPVPTLKAIRIRDAESFRLADDYPGVDLLTDTYDPALPGGVGRAYDPALVRDLVARRRTLIAGGLTPETVGGVVEFLRPWGVDVSSGVEISPGVKDPVRVQDFICAVRSGDQVACDSDGRE